MARNQGSEKVLAKLHKSVEDGNYYEAHQMYLSLAQRYSKQDKVADSIALLSSGAELLLKHAQVGSGSELAMKLVETCIAGSVEPTSDSIARLLTLISLFPAGSPQFRDFAAIASKYSSMPKSPAGSQALHHALGLHFSASHLYYDAEVHFLYGTKDSTKALGVMYGQWSKLEKSMFAGYFCIRGVLGYLALNRIACADSLLETFTATISAKPTSKLPFLKLDIPVYADPLLTLSRIIILVIQRENSRTEFMQIRDEVLGIVDDRYIEKLFESLGSKYYKIQQQRKPNMMADLMSNLFSTPSS